MGRGRNIEVADEEKDIFPKSAGINIANLQKEFFAKELLTDTFIDGNEASINFTKQVNKSIKHTNRYAKNGYGIFRGNRIKDLYEKIRQEELKKEFERCQNVTNVGRN